MDAKQVWQAALERVRRRVSPGAFEWFGGTSGLDLCECRLSVAVPNTFTSAHLTQRFSELARIAVSEVIGQRAEVSFLVRAAPAAFSSASMPTSGRGGGSRAGRPAITEQAAALFEARPAPAPGPARPTRPARGRLTHRLGSTGTMQPALVTAPVAALGAGPAGPTTTAAPVAAPASPVSGPLHAPATVALGSFERAAPNSGPLHDLHPRYVFETYIVGVSNRLAYAASQEVASAPGERYNPLFIYGGVGLGKTHLLHAVGHRARAEGRSVAYVTAERFTNEIIEAIRQRTTDEFRAKYRAVDVLLVDDVQFIAGKESTEEEFFHTFNTLHESSRQIVLSSDRVPHAMHLHDRLRSRFAWGLMADIQAPDFEQRLEILRAKAAGVAMPIPEEVLVCLARPECANIRSLEGALNRVVAHAQMLRQPLDARLVAQAMAPLEAERAQRPVECAEVLASVARHFGMSIEALGGKSREHGVAWARQVAMYLLREETPASLLQIGQQLGGRDHTTVMHGYSRVSKALLMDERARGDVAAIRASLRG
jgi:chromosomal replication initiator protein